MTLRVLTVCAANICRSPSAEAAISEAAARAGIEVELDSAGTGAWHVGSPPHPQVVAAGERVGLKIKGRARRVNPLDFDRFDVILAMDHSNQRDLEALSPSLEAKAKIRLFRTYDPASDVDVVPDPYGGSDEDYNETIRIVTNAAQGFVDSLVSVSMEDPVTAE